MARIKDSEIIAVFSLIGLVLLGAGLRCLALSEEAAWGDEALTTVCFPADNFSGYLRCVFAEDDRLRIAPVYYGGQYLWSLLFGGGLLALRLMSVFLYVIASVQLYVLVRSIGNHRAAWWAVFFFSVSLFSIYYGQEVRFYALMNVFALAAMQGALWYVRGHLRSGLILALLGNVGLVWTHTFSVVFVLGLGLYMLRFWRQPRVLLLWMGAHSLMAMGLFGWLGWLHYDFGGQSAAYGDMPAGLRELLSTALQFFGGRFSNINPAVYMPGGLSLDVAIGGLALAAVLYGLWHSWYKARAAENGGWAPGEIMLLLVCLVTPVLLLFFLGRLWRPCFFTRYVIYAALPLYALMGLGLAAIPGKQMSRLAGLAFVLMFSWQVLALPRPFRADYGAVVRAIASDPSENQVALALKPFNYDAVVYALRDSGVETELLYGLKEIAGISIARVHEGYSVWAVFYRWDDLASFEARMEEAGLVARRFESAGMPPLTIYHVVAKKKP